MSERPSGQEILVFAAEMKAARDRVGMQANELARRLAVTPAAVSNWERGVRVPSRLDALRIEATMGLTRGTLARYLYPEEGETLVTMLPEDAIAADSRLRPEQKAALLAMLRVLLDPPTLDDPDTPDRLVGQSPAPA